MKRITVDDVRAAYEKTGLKPVRNMWLSNNCGCALTACMRAAGVPRKDIKRADDDFECEALAASRLGLGQVYTDYFVNGFDDCRVPTVAEEETAGYEDGLACAAAIFGEVPA